MKRSPSDSKQRVPSDRSSRPIKAAPTQESNPRESDAPLSGPGRAEAGDSSYNPRFIEFFKLLADMVATDDPGRLFPKRCRVCEREFLGMPAYLRATTPKGHVFEDCKEVMDRPFTMVYRHCTCGNTLVLALTDQNFPALDRMWAMLQDEAAKSTLSLESVVREFSRQCDQFILHDNHPNNRRTTP